MRSSDAIPTKRPAEKRGSPGAGLRASSVRGARLRSIARSATVSCCNARCCRYQTSLIAGTILQGTKLPMRVWFRAMHLLAQGKKGLSSIELGRRLAATTTPPMPYRLLKLAEARWKPEPDYHVEMRATVRGRLSHSRSCQGAKDCGEGPLLVRGCPPASKGVGARLDCWA